VSERRSSADLGSLAEASLSAFPFPERDWESDARAVEARLSESVRGSTDALLLAGPLPSEPGEPTALAATTTPLTNSGVRTQSLADMARRSVEQKQSAERAMARESLALAAQTRPNSEQAATSRGAVSAVHAVEAPPAAPSAPAVSAARASLTALAATKAQLPKLGLALAAAGLALAAAALLWLRAPTPEPLVSSIVQPGAGPARAESPSGLALAPAPGGGAEQAAPAAIDPSTLSREVAAQTAEIKHAKAAAASAAPAISASAAGPSPEKVVLEDDQPSAVPPPPAKPADKALPPDPALRPADSTGGAIPVKPSTGAVQAALGAVMSGARHCVAGDDAASSAVVVFASDGHVQSVSVQGPASGKPSGACIEAQLSRARVQPFAAASFSINATVRPD